MSVVTTENPWWRKNEGIYFHIKLSLTMTFLHLFKMRNIMAYSAPREEVRLWSYGEEFISMNPHHGENSTGRSSCYRRPTGAIFVFLSPNRQFSLCRDKNRSHWSSSSRDIRFCSRELISFSWCFSSTPLLKGEGPARKLKYGQGGYSPFPMAISSRPSVFYEVSKYIRNSLSTCHFLKFLHVI